MIMELGLIVVIRRMKMACENTSNMSYTIIVVSSAEETVHRLLLGGYDDDAISAGDSSVVSSLPAGGCFGDSYPQRITSTSRRKSKTTRFRGFRKYRRSREG